MLEAVRKLGGTCLSRTMHCSFAQHWSMIVMRAPNYEWVMGLNHTSSFHFLRWYSETTVNIEATNLYFKLLRPCYPLTVDFVTFAKCADTGIATLHLFRNKIRDMQDFLLEPTLSLIWGAGNHYGSATNISPSPSFLKPKKKNLTTFK